MRRKLTLVRHAKSSWTETGLTDIDRPLNDRGLKNAPEMGKRLAKVNFTVDTIISSPAVRAITTAKIIAEEIGFDVKQIIQNEHIYGASVNVLLDLVRSLDAHVNKAMLVGHNPSFTVLCNYLSNVRIDNMPTCSIAQIQFNVNSWEAITKHSGELIDFDYPKNI